MPIEVCQFKCQSITVKEKKTFHICVEQISGKDWHFIETEL